MEVEKLFGSAIAELEQMLNSKTVVGEPIKVDGSVVIPLVSVGFGFGAGGGATKATDVNGAGARGMTAGGGGVRPVAVLISDKNGVRVESFSTATSMVTKVADTIGEIARNRDETKRLTQNPQPAE